MYERTKGLSRWPAQRQPGQQPAPQPVASPLTRTNPRLAALNVRPPNLSPRDPATDPCFGLGHVAAR